VAPCRSQHDITDITATPSPPRSSAPTCMNVQASHRPRHSSNRPLMQHPAPCTVLHICCERRRHGAPELVATTTRCAPCCIVVAAWNRANSHARVMLVDHFYRQPVRPECRKYPVLTLTRYKLPCQAKCSSVLIDAASQMHPRILSLRNMSLTSRGPHRQGAFALPPDAHLPSQAKPARALWSAWLAQVSPGPSL